MTATDEKPTAAAMRAAERLVPRWAEARDEGVALVAAVIDEETRLRELIGALVLQPCLCRGSGEFSIECVRCEVLESVREK
jgi:hypothetical protein